MLVTTTPTVEGYPVTQYLRVVCGETIAGVNVLKDMAAGFRNFVGGRSQTYETELIQARESALAEMVGRRGCRRRRHRLRDAGIRQRHAHGDGIGNGRSLLTRLLSAPLARPVVTVHGARALPGWVVLRQHFLGDDPGQRQDAQLTETSQDIRAVERTSPPRAAHPDESPLREVPRLFPGVFPSSFQGDDVR